MSEKKRISLTLLQFVLALFVIGSMASAGELVCIPSDTTFCLSNERFEVRVTWRDFAGNQGSGRTVSGGTEDSGIFYFFNANNWEMLVKVLDGCSLNDRFWVFAAATTNVEYTLTVTDTLTGAVSTYLNPLGVSSPAITDTDAFPTCGGTFEAPLKIIPPVSGGMYLGQYEWILGDIETFEAAVGQDAAFWYRQSPFEEGRIEDGRIVEGPQFIVDVAEDAWDAGKIVLAGAWDGVDLAEAGIGIDSVLAGDIDSQLEALAVQFAAFGKPFFFMSAREPNGIGLPYMGGFGPAGTESQWWAIDHETALDQFDPSVFPNPELYEGLGDPEVCDGVERLAALQRYYHDFFVRKHGLDFITFDGLGWGTLTVDELWPGEYFDRGYSENAYAREVAESCLDYGNAYPGNQYTDWISMTYYMLDFYAADWEEIDEDFFLPDSYYLNALDSALARMSEVAPDKPILFIELGFPDGRDADSEIAARKVNAFFNHVLDHYPQVRGFTMWSFADFFDDPTSPFYFPFDCLLREGTAQGDALRAIVEANPAKFNSCAYLADGASVTECGPARAPD